MGQLGGLTGIPGNLNGLRDWGIGQLGNITNSLMNLAGLGDWPACQSHRYLGGSGWIGGLASLLPWKSLRGLSRGSVRSLGILNSPWKSLGVPRSLLGSFAIATLWNPSNPSKSLVLCQLCSCAARKPEETATCRLERSCKVSQHWSDAATFLKAGAKLPGFSTAGLVHVMLALGDQALAQIPR